MHTRPPAAKLRPASPLRSADRRRRLLGLLLGWAAGGAAAASAALPATAGSEVWLELSEPVAAAGADRPAAPGQRRRVVAQQQRIGARLHELGIAELGRVQHARNAILVRVTPRQAEQASAIEGVLRLRPAHTLHPPVPARKTTE